jgi:hypothetical protein
VSKSNLVYRNCALHKLNTNLTDHKDLWLLISSLTDDAHVEWNTFVSWLWYLVRRPETAYETNLLFILLDLYLHEDTKLKPELKKRFINFVGKNFQEEENKHCEHNFIDVMHLDKNTSNTVEVENSAIKRHGFDFFPPPNNGPSFSEHTRTNPTNKYAH